MNSIVTRAVAASLLGVGVAATAGNPGAAQAVVTDAPGVLSHILSRAPAASAEPGRSDNAAVPPEVRLRIPDVPSPVQPADSLYSAGASDGSALGRTVAGRSAMTDPGASGVRQHDFAAPGGDASALMEALRAIEPRR